MAKKRLTNKMREDIVDSIIEKTVSKKITDKRIERSAIGTKIYDLCMQKFRTSVDSLPASFMPTSSVLRVCLSNVLGPNVVNCDTGEFDSGEMRLDIGMTAGERVPVYSSMYGSPVFSMGETTPLILDYRNAESEVGELVDQRKALTRELKAAIMNFKNVEQIESEWGEIYQYVPEHIKSKDVVSLPAVKLDSINQMIQKVAA